MFKVLLLLVVTLFPTLANAEGTFCVDAKNFDRVLAIPGIKIIGTGIMGTSGEGVVTLVVFKDGDWLIFGRKAGSDLRCGIAGGSNWDSSSDQKETTPSKDL